MSQKTVVLRHLQSKTITSKTAFSRYGITRLADVVFKLKGDGHDISTSLESVRTRYGTTATIARYSLVN